MVLDPDGYSYGGDERERLRWYEGMTITAHFQWLAVSWFCAIAVFVYGSSVVEVLTAVLIVMYLPNLLCMAYLSRRRRIRASPDVD